MKFVILLCILGALLLECHSSPVQLVENHELVAKSKAAAVSGRQSNNDIAPAAVSNSDNDEDEDDDEDDDDEPDLGDLVDDDDDDEDDDEDDTPQGQQAAPAADDDEEDDEEDDYLDRIFDDLLDDEDDEDDDDDETSSANAPAAVQQQPAVASVLQPASAVNGAIDVPSSVSGEPAIAGQSADYPAEGEQNVFYDEENGGIDTKVDVQSLNNQPPVVPSTTTKVTVAQNDEASSDDDDDDDDEDDITGALSDDDDDDDDDAEDDDDDDDIVGDDVIEARRARAFKNNEAAPSGKDAFQDRHNRFIDAIFDRINNIVSSSYDPFKVRLNSNPKQAKANAAGKKRKQQKSDKKGRSLLAAENATGIKKKRRTIDSTNETFTKVQSSIEPISSLLKKSVDDVTAAVDNDEDTTNAAEVRTTKSANKITTKKAYNTPSGTTGKPLSSSSSSSSSLPASASAASINKQKLKQNIEEKLRKAEGTLYGLASLKRVGNVKVVTDPEGKNSTIKSKFTLGPLTLKVEKSFKRGNVRSVKSATAKTNEMIGRIKFRVVNDSATLMSIKVQQPKQVEVESKDNHDRTREFVWKRTPHIAHLVSEKLKMAAESLFEPTGSEVVRL